MGGMMAVNAQREPSGRYTALSTDAWEPRSNVTKQELLQSLKRLTRHLERASQVIVGSSPDFDRLNQAFDELPDPEVDHQAASDAFDQWLNGYSSQLTRYATALHDLAAEAHETWSRYRRDAIGYYSFTPLDSAEQREDLQKQTLVINGLREKVGGLLNTLNSARRAAEEQAEQWKHTDLLVGGLEREARALQAALREYHRGTTYLGEADEIIAQRLASA